MDDLIVKKSKIHGQGVFANRDFRKGEKVLAWDLSHKILKKKVEKLSPEAKRGTFFWRGRYYVATGFGKYLNHSCDANTYAKKACDFAKKNIKKGEEITIDMSQETVVGPRTKCHCGSRNCRGWVELKDV